MDRYFGNVCELDIIFNFHKAYYLLDELVMGGELQETNKKEVLDIMAQQEESVINEKSAGECSDHNHTVNARGSVEPGLGVTGALFLVSQLPQGASGQLLATLTRTFNPSLLYAASLCVAEVCGGESYIGGGLGGDPAAWCRAVGPGPWPFAVARGGRAHWQVMPGRWTKLPAQGGGSGGVGLRAEASGKPTH